MSERGRWFLGGVALLVLLFAGCGGEGSIDSSALGLPENQVDTTQSGLVSIQSAGGSNFAWYTISNCDMEPYGIIYNYHDANVASTVRSQLATMFANGMRRLRINIFFCSGCGKTGTVMDSTGGDLSPQHRANLQNFLADIKSKGFQEVMLAMHPQGQNNPETWTTYSEAMVQENFNLIVNLRPIFVNSGLQYRIDLMNEASPKPSELILRDYCKAIWSKYVTSFGKGDTVGFSIRPGENADEMGSRIQMLPYVYNYNYPNVFSMHFYYNVYASFLRVHAELNSIGQGQGWIIGETFYNDAGEADEFRRAIAATGRTIYYLTQWPLTMQWKCGTRSDVGSPTAYNNYLPLSGGTVTPTTPVIINAGPGCSDNNCIWINGKYFENNVRVDIKTTSNTLLRSYNTTTIRNSSYDSTSLALATSQEKSLFASTGLMVLVVNPSTGKWSNAVIVKGGGGGGGATPQIINAGSGCSDNYCIWINGKYFEDNVRVDIKTTSNTLLRSYNTRTSRGSSYDSTSLALATSQEKSLFASTGLMVLVVNPSTGKWSNAVVVKR